MVDLASRIAEVRVTGLTDQMRSVDAILRYRLSQKTIAMPITKATQKDMFQSLDDRFSEKRMFHIGRPRNQ